MRMLFLLGALLLVACGDDPPADGAGGQGAGDAGGAGGSPPSSLEPDPAFLPTPTGACPAFEDTTVTFAPAGIAPRNVRLFLDPATLATPGPMLFYWHGNGSSPTLEPPYGLDPELTSIKAAGGIVAAPYSDGTSSFAWHLTTGAGAEDDLILADEVLACALAQGYVDKRRIHVIGMSAGGLNTVQMAYRRSGYVASAVSYSGGLLGAPDMQQPTNLFPMMIFHGGPNDMVVINFEQVSQGLYDELRALGHFATICNHGMNHTIPKGQAEQTSIWRFFQDHPFGTDPSPYAAGLPAGFPPYCVL